MQMPQHAPPSRFVTLAAAGGLACTLVILSLNGMLTFDAAEAGATTVGALAFAAVFAAPFLLVLSSLALPDLARRRAIWLAGAVVTFMLAVLSLFSVGMIFLFVAGALAWAWWDARRRDTSSLSRMSSLLTLWLVGSLGAAFALLLVWRETPMCWGTTAGQSGWGAPGLANATTCTTDIIDTTEGALALGSIALGVVGMAVILRAWGARR